MFWINRVRGGTALALAAAMMLGLTACGRTESDQTDLEKITFVLDWTPNTNHTGLYAALENGYFTEAGLDVEIAQPPEDGAEVLVGSGKAHFGVSFQDSMAPGLTGDDPLPVTAVAAVVQHNTSGIVSLENRGIDTPRKLEGYKYATWDLPVEKATIRQIMERDGGDFSKVELIPSTFTDEVSALESGSVDAIWIFYGWAGIACQTAGLAINYFAFADIDPVFDYYTPVIIANNTFLEENPETARAFLAALSKGYEYAAEHPREAAEILMNAVPELRDSETLIYASQEYLSAQYIADSTQWGMFDPKRWSAFYTWLLDNRLIDETLAPSSGFTNEFLPGN